MESLLTCEYDVLTAMVVPVVRGSCHSLSDDDWRQIGDLSQPF